MHKQFLISILIPTYNREELIGGTLDSILAQTYQNWECIVIDDGSTDNTLTILEKYALKDTRIKYYKRPNHHLPGGNGARNYAYLKSIGDLIQWFDSDDVMHPEKLEIQSSILSNSKLNYCVCQSYIFENEITPDLELKYPKIISRNPKVDYISKKVRWYSQSVLWKRSFLKNKRLFDEELKSGQEWEFHSRMLCYDSNYEVIEKPLFYFRKHENSITRNKADEEKRLWNYFLARYKIYNNGNLNLTELEIKNLTNRMFKFYKKLVRGKMYKSALKVFKLFILPHKALKLSSKIRLLMAIFSFKFFNTGNRLLKV